MVNAYNSIIQSLDEGAFFSFDTNSIINCLVAHPAGSTVFTLNRPGYYLVSFNASGVTSGTAGNMIAQLTNNGTDVEGAMASAYSGAATEDGSLAFTTLIRVKPSCCMVNNAANLRVENTGVAADYGTAAMTIVKLD